MEENSAENNTVLTEENIFSHFSENELKKRTSEKWRKYDSDVLPLWIAEMDAPLPDAVCEETQRLCQTGDTGYESDSDAHRYLSSYHDFAHRQWGVSIDISHGRSTSDVISGIRAVIERSLGCRPAPAESRAQYEGFVVVETPVYPPFLNRLPENYSLEFSPLDPTTHRTDFKTLETVFSRLSAIKPTVESPSGYNTVFVLCSPHNPTGTVYTEDELNHIAQLCEQYHVLLIGDEIHSPLITDPSARPFVPLLAVQAAQNAIVSVSASKGFSLPGFKAALLIAGSGKNAQNIVDSLSEKDVHSGSHIAMNVHAAAFESGDEWLAAITDGIEKNKKLLKNLLAKKLPQARAIIGAGTYLCFVDISDYCVGTAWDRKASEALIKHAKVAFNSGSDFGGSQWGNYVRINVATNPQILEKAVTQMSDFLTANKAAE